MFFLNHCVPPLFRIPAFRLAVNRQCGPCFSTGLAGLARVFKVASLGSISDPFKG